MGVVEVTCSSISGCGSDSECEDCDAEGVEVEGWRERLIKNISREFICYQN